ncbi:MAG TPA: HAD family phosphatase [Candidatus Saccharibacteria bacterium]|nr:HAD family phosphatase [Candidatus Saccharibacteria bacterium]
MRKQFAVFDIDGTIARTSLLQLMTRELVARGRLDIGPGHDIEVLLHDYRQRISDETFGSYMKQAVDLLFKNLPKGLSLEEYNGIIDSVVKKSLTSTYVYTRELAQTLKRNNFFLIAISGSEVRAVSTFARSLGFDAWVGQVNYLEENGMLTGEVQTLTQTKAQILDVIIKKFDLETRGSTAVGDTSSDISILEKVDSPIVFNPNQALFKVAREKSWMVVIERKDMVYGLVHENGQYVLKQVNV